MNSQNSKLTQSFQNWTTNIQCKHTFIGRHDTQHNDIQHNDIQHNNK
jgi:hypothetical protein